MCKGTTGAFQILESVLHVYTTGQRDSRFVSTKYGPSLSKYVDTYIYVCLCTIEQVTAAIVYKLRSSKDIHTPLFTVQYNTPTYNIIMYIRLSILLYALHYYALRYFLREPLFSASSPQPLINLSHLRIYSAIYIQYGIVHLLTCEDVYLSSLRFALASA